MPSTGLRPLSDLTTGETLVEAGKSRGVPIPWWSKIAAKMILARVLTSYPTRKAFGLFRHGASDANIEAERILYDAAIAWHRDYGGGPLAAALELGPGDSAGSALFFAAAGASRTWLIDVGDFATRDMVVYRRIADLIERRTPGRLTHISWTDRDSLLASLGACYLTRGMQAFGDVPSDSVDLVFSKSVLEHVRRAEFAGLLAETFRVLRPGGIAHHRIDLMDHLGGALNNLRFRHDFWESQFVVNSGFYSNRLRHSEIVAAMRAAGFELAVTHVRRWPAPTLPRSKLAAPFRTFSDDELRIANFGVLLRKPVQAGLPA